MELMHHRIKNIMIVCSAYDMFILNEDGRIEQQIANEYSELNLTDTPEFTSFCDAGSALVALEQGAKFELIITMFNIGDIDVFEFSRRVKSINIETPIVLLSSFSHTLYREIEQKKSPTIDYIFNWQGSAELILAIIKLLEDKLNAKGDMLGQGIQGILLVEDSTKFYSVYLPELYSLVLGQANDFAMEALNDKGRSMCRRSRPKILFARSYQEAIELYDLYKDNLLGVISDISFPCKHLSNEIDELAGIKLFTHIRATDKYIPLLLQSSSTHLSIKSSSVDADFIDKNSKSLFKKLEHFVKKRMAFGDLSLIDPETNIELVKISNLEQLHSTIQTIPSHILLYYASKNMFSHWLYARGLFRLGQELRHISTTDFNSADELRSCIFNHIKSYRRSIGVGVIAEFNSSYNKYITFAKVGTGSLGGKARGIAFLNEMVDYNNLQNKWDNVLVTVPRTLCITTEYYDKFIQHNSLNYLSQTKLDDKSILSEFIDSQLDSTLISYIKQFLSTVERPIAVRSSSQLEDSYYQPFAGVYSTYMVPYVEDLSKRTRLVLRAIKSVYASVYFHSSREYISASGHILKEEKMAIILQELCGSKHGRFFYPTFSGVARSLNFYPLPNEPYHKGVCNISVGLGKGVISGGETIRFSPFKPKHALHLTDTNIALRNSQKTFWALDTNPSCLKHSTNDSINLYQLPINKIFKTSNLSYVASSWSSAESRMYDNADSTDKKVITFASILKYNTIPLAQIIKTILEIGSKSFQSPIEIEFAVNMSVSDSESYLFNLLQIRPIVEPSIVINTKWESVTPNDNTLVYSTQALGMSMMSDIEDIIYVRPEFFNPSVTSKIAESIKSINAKFVRSKRGYILIGSGRWGSSDPWLGIPIKWSDISQARLIAECNTAEFNPDPSQGTHFFQNLTSFGIGYLTLNPELGNGYVNYDKFNNMDAIYENKYIRHIRFDKPLNIVIDGNNNKALIEEA